MSSARSDYSPISCEFHDILEATATTRKVVQLEFVDDAGSMQSRSARVVDVYSRDRVEYIALSSGETVRLDRLQAVDGVSLADFGRNSTTS